MRAIPNMNISAPADCAELGKMLEDYTINERGPSYIRLSGVPIIKKFMIKIISIILEDQLNYLMVKIF